MLGGGQGSEGDWPAHSRPSSPIPGTQTPAVSPCCSHASLTISDFSRQSQVSPGGGGANPARMTSSYHSARALALSVSTSVVAGTFAEPTERGCPGLRTTCDYTWSPNRWWSEKKELLACSRDKTQAGSQFPPPENLQSVGDEVLWITRSPATWGSHRWLQWHHGTPANFCSLASFRSERPKIHGASRKPG